MSSRITEVERRIDQFSEDKPSPNTPEATTVATFDQWAIVELMGHVRMSGRVTEVELFGHKIGRIDIPNDDGFTTHFFGGGSLYRMTPTTEEIARAVASRNQPEPVHQWELSSARQIERGDSEFDPYSDE